MVTVKGRRKGFWWQAGKYETMAVKSTNRRNSPMSKVRAMIAVAVFGLVFAGSASSQQERWSEFNTRVFAPYQEGNYREAAVVAQQALAVAEEAFGSEYPAVAESMNNLAELYRIQGCMRKPNPSTAERWRSLQRPLGQMMLLLPQYRRISYVLREAGQGRPIEAFA